ncbi:hypothetical protein [Myxococcus landrumensis]|uniref:Lipoprotein n=1 Tax=Myxococcus landrumensis TaxID=2813577 RepID=A0ABX7NFD4_9BACT|nr:hypothetical protein [Myxococcus landrumus]QSQ17094.1 hypothetical protein JY572_13975 [Myxococcus landrumus]
MRVRSRWAWVLWVLAAACGGFPDESPREVKAQACPPGVASRVRIVNPPGLAPQGHVEGLTDVQGTLYFTVTPVWVGGAVLWRSDGTEVGTVPVRSFPSGVYAGGVSVAAGSTLFFQLFDQVTGMVELWASDGTDSGTRFIRAFTPDISGPALRGLTALNDKRVVFFHQTPTGTTEVWSSDGTRAGTMLLATLTEVIGLAFHQTLKVGDDLLFFRIQRGATTLWRTDGSRVGTEAFKKLDSGEVSVAQVGGAGDQGLFILRDGPNREIWKTDGTTDGTLRLDTFGEEVRLLGGLGSKVYVAQSSRLYSLLLSGGGRTLVTTLPRDNENQSLWVQRAVRSGDSLYFAASLEGQGPMPDDVRLWVTNGTARGTRELFRSLQRDDMSYSPVFATGTGTVLFLGSRGGAPLYPWFTRGTAGTTGQLASVDVPVVQGLGPDPFVRSGGRVFFPASDDTGLEQLWSVPASFTCPPGVSEAQ